MCTGAEMLLLSAASTAVSAIGAAQEGKQRQRQANEQARQVEAADARQRQATQFQVDQARADADAERGAAQVAAEKVRKAGSRTRSEATAALAASGVEVGAGTPIAIDQEIVRTAEEEALQNILYGNRRADRLEQGADVANWETSMNSQAAADQAGYLRASGRNARTASLLSAGGRVLEGWTSVARGRRDVRPQQAPAPVYDLGPGGAVRVG